MPPLYKIVQGTKFKYLKDDKALEEFKNLNKKAFELNRMKGLGEMDAHEMEETVMNPNTRTLKQITMEDLSKTSQIFNKLMGESVAGRKKFIEENAWRANVDI